MSGAVELGAPVTKDRLGRNLTHGLLDTLGKAIVTGRYRDQPFPTEAEIARAHGVSRSVTREAVKMLTAKGLVSARPRQGTVVEPSASWNLFDADVLRWLLDREFSVDLLRQFNELRFAIEPEAAALAAACHGPADLELIEHRFAEMEAAEQGYADTLEADIAFHVAILKASKNPFYAQFEAVVATALRTSIRFTNHIKGHSANLGDHAAVLGGIRDRDVPRARTTMQKIVGDVLKLIEANGSGPVSSPR